MFFLQKKAPAATYQDQKHIFHKKKGACGSTPGSKKTFFFADLGLSNCLSRTYFFGILGRFLGPLGPKKASMISIVTKEGKRASEKGPLNPEALFSEARSRFENVSR